MKKIIHFFFAVLMLSLSSCASIFISKKQNVEFNTKTKDAVVYANNEEIGKGKTFSTKIQRGNTVQIVVQAPEYKDSYYAMLATKRPGAFWPLLILDIPLAPLYGISFLYDFQAPNCTSFDKVQTITPKYKYIYRATDDKYVDLSAIKLNIKDKDKDFKYYYVEYKEDLDAQFDKAEKASQKEAEKLAKKEAKKKKVNKLENDNSIKFDDTKFSDNVYKTLKKTGYIDTINRIFPDNNNTIQVEGVISHISRYSVSGLVDNYYKSKLDIKWYIKNTYGETLDSVKLTEYSGDFAIPYVYGKDNSDKFYKMYADAVDVSFIKLLSNATYKKYAKINTDFKMTDPVLTVSKPKQYVQEPSDAMAASVIIKRKDKGHGSGFAITNDGYILTNFHVIAGKTPNKQEELTVVLSTGEEIPAKVIRFNRMRDIALLKIDRTFAKPFLLASDKTFKILQEVYTVGAPKSVELGQSITLGLLSNERNQNNNSLLQLNMSVNSGNSGGPLFDRTGVLHGVIKSKLVGFSTEGIGFAIPSYLIPEYLNLAIK